jgi:alpha-mannosidase
MPGTMLLHIQHVYATDKETLQRLEDNKKKSGLPIDFSTWVVVIKTTPTVVELFKKFRSKHLRPKRKQKALFNVLAGKADLMFRAITDEQAAQFPTHNKDLLLIQHSTGVLTSQAYTKKLNRDAELLADASERAAVAAHLLKGAEYPYGALNHAWGLMLRNQFHDNLPGTSIPKAYEYAWNDGIVALNQFAGVYKDAMGTLAQLLHTDVPGLPVVVFNPLSIPRKDIVEAFLPDEFENAESVAVFDASGKEVASQITQGFDGLSRILFQADLPPIGVSVYSFRQTQTKKVDSN